MAASGSTSTSTSASRFAALVHKDGGPNTYNKLASSYEADVNSFNYVGHKSVVSKWRSYHTELARSDSESTGIKHKVFDAGCGTGLVGEDLTTLVPRDLIEIYGGDVSHNMLEKARTKDAYTDLRIVNLKEELLYEDGYFDSVLCAGVFTVAHCGLECVPNLIRVLKKGCYLFATVNRLIYNETTKVEWDKQFKDCNCELLEDNEIPYAEGFKAVLVVIRKLPDEEPHM